jgi:hypothetical protein
MKMFFLLYKYFRTQRMTNWYLSRNEVIFYVGYFNDYETINEIWTAATTKFESRISDISVSITLIVLVRQRRRYIIRNSGFEFRGSGCSNFEFLCIKYRPYKTLL